MLSSEKKKKKNEKNEKKKKGCVNGQVRQKIDCQLIVDSVAQ